MYYLIYGLLYLMSLLPFWLLYLLSDFVAFLLYNVFSYRKEVVLYNLSIAFPKKTIEERKKIAKKFYINLTDTFIETIKMLSLSDKEFERRCTIDMGTTNELAAKGLNIQIHGGHQMNWEYINWAVGKNLTIPFIVIYQPISSKAMNKIFYDLRSRPANNILVATTEFRTKMHQFFKTQYAIGLGADQNTSPATGYWLYFFNKPVPFIMGPERGALKNKTAVVFANLVKKKRGYYHFELKTITENAGLITQKGELTRMYRDFLEHAISEHPDNYLWTHRRWRHEYAPEFEHRWIDTRPRPA